MEHLARCTHESSFVNPMPHPPAFGFRSARRTIFCWPFISRPRTCGNLLPEPLTQLWRLETWTYSRNYLLSLETTIGEMIGIRPQKRASAQTPTFVSDRRENPQDHSHMHIPRTRQVCRACITRPLARFYTLLRRRAIPSSAN